MMHWSTEQSPSASNTGRDFGSTSWGSCSSDAAGVRPNASSARTPRRTNRRSPERSGCAAGRRRLPRFDAHRRQQHRVGDTGAVGNRCARGTAPGGA